MSRKGWWAYCLVRGHRLYTTFPNALWDTLWTQTAGFNLRCCLTTQQQPWKKTAWQQRGDTFALPSVSGLCSLQSHPENQPKVQKRFEKSLKNMQTDRLHLNRRSAPRVETPEASSSQRKPEQGQHPSGIHHTGICQTKTSFWKFGKQLGVTAFPAPHYGTFRRTKEEKSTLRLDVFASLFLW